MKSSSIRSAFALIFGVFTLLLVPCNRVVAAENQALKLDGNGGYVELPNDLFTNLTQGTVEVWVKWNAFANYSRVFEFGGNFQTISMFNDAAKPDLRFNVYPRAGARAVITATNLLRANEWIHLAAVSGPGGMQLFANGRLVGQNSSTASFGDISMRQTNYLGRGLTKSPGDLDFRGEIDELRIWNQQRTVAQIRDNMFKRMSGHEEGLVHLWNFDDGTAKDSCSEAGRGTLQGNASVVLSDLGLIAETPVVAAAPVPAPQPAPPATPAAAPGAAVPPPSNGGSGTVAWWIAGALSALVVLMAWLLLMLRRSGVGSEKLTTSESSRARLPAGATVSAAPAHDELKQRALAELTDFAKQSLVQGLYSQRAVLLEAQKQAQVELAELEARMMALQLPERIQAYEKRIAELEAQLETRGEEFRELTQTTIKVLRAKLEAEKLKAEKPSQFN